MELFRVKPGYPMCFFVVFLFQMTDAALPSNVLAGHSELLQKLKSYEVIKPYRVEGGIKRYASTRSNIGHVEETTLVLDGIKNHFTLDLFLNKGLFSPGYTEHRVLHDGTEVKRQKLHENCFYQGTVRGQDNSSSVSLSTCDGIEGVITTTDGLFFIHPLKSKEGNVLEEHLVFSNNDLNEEPVTCGRAHEISPKKEFNHLKELSGTKRRVRRSVQNETKYVELFIINDVNQYRKYRENTELRAKQLGNHLDSIYRPQRIRIALVKIETWKYTNRFAVSANATITLSNFLKYKKLQLDKDKGKHWDNIQFVTNLDFLTSTVGYAPIRSICGSGSVAIIQDHSNNAAVTAATMAHFLGHNFGMRHDVSTCECPANNEKCIMSAVLSTSSPATQFSSCSLNELRKTLDEGYGMCLFDEPQMLSGPAICGNGFVEEGEQCDCGTQEECVFYKNKCCNATTCTLQPGAACSHGECCESCQFRSKGYLCREKYDYCDLPEYCSGSNQLCPEDTYVHNGVICKDSEVTEGYCYDGVCRGLTLQCRFLFGGEVTAGNDRCFARNTKNHAFYGCYNETHGHFACPVQDVKCGKIHCLSNTKIRPKVGQDRNYYSVTADGRTFCLVPILTSGDGQDLQFVQDGTKCGENMMCKDSRCLPINEVMPKAYWESCPNNCSLSGICNNKGNCHCDSGYACPDCATKGPGGSVDSGQGCVGNFTVATDEPQVTTKSSTTKSSTTESGSTTKKIPGGDGESSGGEVPTVVIVVIVLVSILFFTEFCSVVAIEI